MKTKSKITMKTKAKKRKTEKNSNTQECYIGYHKTML